MKQGPRLRVRCRGEHRQATEYGLPEHGHPPSRRSDELAATLGKEHENAKKTAASLADERSARSTAEAERDLARQQAASLAESVRAKDAALKSALADLRSPKIPDVSTAGVGSKAAPLPVQIYRSSNNTKYNTTNHINGSMILFILIMILLFYFLYIQFSKYELTIA